MTSDLVDLTRLRPSSAAPWTVDKTDVIILVTTGGVGYLAKEAFKYFFPGRPSVVEQLAALAQVIEACGRAGAKALKVRVSTDAKVAWQMPKAVASAKVLWESPTTVDLEIFFCQPPRRRRAAPAELTL